MPAEYGHSDRSNSDHDDEILCPECEQINPRHAERCVKCNAALPVSYEPDETLPDQQAAVQEPGRTGGFVLLGLWLVGVPMAVFVAMIGFGLLGRRGAYGGVSCFMGLASLGFICLYAAALWSATRHYFRVRRLPLTGCETCGYQLRGWPPAKCPECGHQLQGEEARSRLRAIEETGPVTPSWVRSERVYAIAVAVCIAWTALWVWYAGAEFAPLAAFAAMLAALVLLFGGMQRIADKSQSPCSAMFWCAFVLDLVLVVGFVVAALAMSDGCQLGYGN
jgi:hypothetical protein